MPNHNFRQSTLFVLFDKTYALGRDLTHGELIGLPQSHHWYNKKLWRYKEDAYNRNFRP